MKGLCAICTAIAMALVLCAAQPATPQSASLIAPTHPLWMLLHPHGEAFVDMFLSVHARTHRDATDLAGQVSTHAKDVADRTHIRPFWFETVEDAEEVRALTLRYGVPMSYIQELNPGVDFSSIDASARVLIYRANPDMPAQSIGSASGGHFVQGMPMITDPHWIVRNPARAWATPQTVRRLAAGLRYIAARYPGASTMMIGDMSRFGGGRIRPHRSHQSGRDADVSYYRLGNVDDGQFWDARSAEFDVARTWALFRYWITRGWVQFIFVDHAIQRMLADYAYSVGEDPAFVQRVIEIEGGDKRSIIRYSPGHAHHFHVRFRCEKADIQCK